MTIKAALMYGITIPKAYKLSEQAIEDIESLSDVHNLEVDTNYDIEKNLKSMSIGIYAPSLYKTQNEIGEHEDTLGVSINTILQMKKEFEEGYNQQFMSELVELLTQDVEYEGLDLMMHLTNGASVIAIAYEV